MILGKSAIMRGIQIGSRVQCVALVLLEQSAQSCSLVSYRFEDMNRLISAVKLKPVVDKVFDFEHVRDAYEYLHSQQHVGKVVVKVSKD